MQLIYNIVYLTVIAFLNSIDNLGIGITYSIAGIKIPLFKNLLIAIMAFMISFISSLSGGFVAQYLTRETRAIFSMSLLVFMGLSMIYKSLKKQDEDVEKYNVVTNKEAIAVGTLLAIDDVGSSVSSGLIGYGPIMVSIPYFVISLIIFTLANFGTKFFSKLKIGKKATVISGVIMILLGLSQLFG